MIAKEQKKPGLLHQIFVSSNEVRLRAGWRLFLHTIFIIIFSTLAAFVLFIPIGLLKISLDTTLTLLVTELATVVGISAATFLALRFLDKRSISSIGLKLGSRAAMDTLVGITIPLAQMGLIFGLELALGWTKFEGFAWQFHPITFIANGLGMWLIVFLIVGWQEELLSRGYHLQTIESGINIFWALIISSSVFGFLHIFNPAATWLSTIGIILAGLFLALPYILTRQLWLSIGLHIGWNFFEGVVFGFPVSGLETFKLLHHTESGPDLWTGGAFGPEAGLIVIPALVLGALLVYVYTRSDIRKLNIA